MARSHFSFTAEVWEHEGPAAWHFISLPEAVADEIEAAYGHRAAGFGSLRVEVTIGKTRWSTSVLPDRRRGAYVLPLKKEVRVAEQAVAGAPANLRRISNDDSNGFAHRAEQVAKEQQKAACGTARPSCSGATGTVASGSFGVNG